MRPSDLLRLPRKGLSCIAVPFENEKYHMAMNRPSIYLHTSLSFGTCGGPSHTSKSASARIWPAHYVLPSCSTAPVQAALKGSGGSHSLEGGNAHAGASEAGGGCRRAAGGSAARAAEVAGGGRREVGGNSADQGRQHGGPPAGPPEHRPRSPPGAAAGRER